MVTAIAPNSAAETNRSGGRDAKRSEAAGPSPKKQSKALRSAITKRAMMVQAGASDESIAIMDARIAKLTPKPKTAAPVEDSVARLQRLLADRLSWLDVLIATGQIEGAQEYAAWLLVTPLADTDEDLDWTKDVRDVAEVAAA